MPQSPHFIARNPAGDLVPLNCDASGNLLVSTGTSYVLLSQLPTVDPHVVGAVWNNAGTPVVSAG